MTEIPADIEKTARDIMDNACLGEPWCTNGVVKALTSDITHALLAEREACAKIAHDRRIAWLNAAQARREAAFSLPTSFQTERAGEAEFIAAAIRSERAGE